jgi:hypothetical protein
VHAKALGGFPAPFFYQLDTSANSVIQQGFFFESGTSDDLNPSIVANTGGDAFVTWTSTDATSTTGLQHDSRVRFSGRQAADSAGVIGAGSSLITSPVALTGNSQNGRQRWGDYSRAALDPATSSCGAGKRALVFNEDNLNANTWGTQIGIIGFCP